MNLHHSSSFYIYILSLSLSLALIFMSYLFFPVSFAHFPTTDWNTWRISSSTHTEGLAMFNWPVPLWPTKKNQATQQKTRLTTPERCLSDRRDNFDVFEATAWPFKHNLMLTSTFITSGLIGHLWSKRTRLYKTTWYISLPCVYEIFSNFLTYFWHSKNTVCPDKLSHTWDSWEHLLVNLEININGLLELGWDIPGSGSQRLNMSIYYNIRVDTRSIQELHI